MSVLRGTNHPRVWPCTMCQAMKGGYACMLNCPKGPDLNCDTCAGKGRVLMIPPGEEHGCPDCNPDKEET